MTHPCDAEDFYRRCLREQYNYDPPLECIPPNVTGNDGGSSGGGGGGDVTPPSKPVDPGPCNANWSLAERADWFVASLEYGNSVLLRSQRLDLFCDKSNAYLVTRRSDGLLLSEEIDLNTDGISDITVVRSTESGRDVFEYTEFEPSSKKAQTIQKTVLAVTDRNKNDPHEYSVEHYEYRVPLTKSTKLVLQGLRDDDVYRMGERHVGWLYEDISGDGTFGDPRPKTIYVPAQMMSSHRFEVEERDGTLCANDSATRTKLGAAVSMAIEKGTTVLARLIAPSGVSLRRCSCVRIFPLHALAISSAPM